MRGRALAIPGAFGRREGTCLAVAPFDRAGMRIECSCIRKIYVQRQTLQSGSNTRDDGSYVVHGDTCAAGCAADKAVGDGNTDRERPGR